MGYAEKLAQEVSSSVEGIHVSAGRYHITKQLNAAVAATATGDANTVLTDSTTTYQTVGVAPKNMTLVRAVVRLDGKGKSSSTTLDILAAASGKGVTEGTAIVTQLECDDLTAKTDFKLTINTDTTRHVPAGSIIIVKLVTTSSETLKPPFIDLLFRL